MEDKLTKFSISEDVESIYKYDGRIGKTTDLRVQCSITYVYGYISECLLRIPREFHFKAIVREDVRLRFNKVKGMTCPDQMHLTIVANHLQLAL